MAFLAQTWTTASCSSTARTRRSRTVLFVHAELLNDFKALTREIEAKLFSFHEQNRKQAQRDIEEYERSIPERIEAAETCQKTVSSKMDEEPAHKEVLEPFCKVVEVQTCSPADESGIKVGDLIVTYGSLNIFNHNSLKAIPEVTKNHIDAVFPVVLLRQGLKVELQVKPHFWSGPGILGCRFVEETK